MKTKRQQWKRRRSDRMNDLPLDIQTKILSFLPIKEAVRTTLLSKHWRNAWLSLPTFDLELGGEEQKLQDPIIHSTWEERSSIVDLLLSRLPTASIRRCRLTGLCGSNQTKKATTRIHRWLSIIKTRGVTELYLYKTDLSLSAILPHLQEAPFLRLLSISSCSLTCPKRGCRRHGLACSIVGPCSAPPAFELGTLKSLMIRSGSICMSALQSLIYGCRAIECVALSFPCVRGSVLDLSCSPNLRSLEYAGIFSMVELKFNRGTRLENVLCAVLDEEFMDGGEQEPGKAAELMSQFVHAHILLLEGNFLKYFARDFKRKLWDRSNKFANLTRLIIWGNLHGDDQAAVIAYLMTCSPCLQGIFFKAKKAGQEGSFSCSYPWRGQDASLGCLKSAIITLCIEEGEQNTCLGDDPWLIGLARFVVMNAHVLERLIIEDTHHKEEVKEKWEDILHREKVSELLCISFL